MAPVPFVSVDVVFDAAHRLRGDTAQCRGLHGHSYRVRVTARQAPQGGAADTGSLRALVQETVFRPLDHGCLNDHLDDPTAERVAGWIWEAVLARAPTLVEVTLAEAPDRAVTLRAEGA